MFGASKFACRAKSVPRLLVVGRLWIFIGAIWAGGYYLTEAMNPLTQAVGIWARLFGAEKSFRTVREFDTRMAVSHLSHAAKKNSRLETVATRPLPCSWRELVIESLDYSGPHLRGTLIESFPFLIQPTDPWGNPWVFRIVEVGRSDGLPSANIEPSVDLKMTFGSLGPDGKECPKKRQGHVTTPRECDDLLSNLVINGVSPDRVPLGTPVEEPELQYYFADDLKPRK